MEADCCRVLPQRLRLRRRSRGGESDAHSTGSGGDVGSPGRLLGAAAAEYSDRLRPWRSRSRSNSFTSESEVSSL